MRYGFANHMIEHIISMLAFNFCTFSQIVQMTSPVIDGHLSYMGDVSYQFSSNFELRRTARALFQGLVQPRDFINFL